MLAAVRSGDTARFASLTERHRRELQVHCYRMLANYEDAQDLTQETFLRAWNKRESFQGRRRAADLAVPDRDERLPRLPGEAQRPHTRPVRAGGPRLRAAVPAAVPRPDAPRGPAGIGGGAGDDRAGVHRRRPAPAAAAAGGAHPARRPRLAGVDGRRRPRPDPRLGDQRAAAGPRDDARAAARPPPRLAEPRHPRAVGRRARRGEVVHRRPRAQRPRRADVPAAQGPALRDAARAGPRAHDGRGRGGRLGLRRALPSAATTTGAAPPRRSTACRPPCCTSAPPTTRSTDCSPSRSCSVVDGEIAELIGFDAADTPWLDLPPTL